MNQARYQKAKRITLLSLVINAVLSILKLLVGFIGHSQALIADGVHSLSDLLTDSLVLFAAKASSHGPDDDHPYGHARFETVVTVFLAIILLFVGLGIAFDALHHILFSHVSQVPDFLVMVIALISVLANEFLFHVTLRVAKQIKSELLHANAWHNRSDALSSFVVLIGALVSYFGFRWGDAIAAIIVSVFIIKMAISMGWRNIRELVDTGVDEQTKKKLFKAIQKIPGVIAVHQLRSRLLAGDVYLDVHVQVEPKISVSEGHFISDQVMAYLYQQFKEVKDVTVHIDPEDDENERLSEGLPSRHDIIAILEKHSDALPGWKGKERIVLHYLQGALLVEVFLSFHCVDKNHDVKKMAEAYRAVLKSLGKAVEVVLYFS